MVVGQTVGPTHTYPERRWALTCSVVDEHIQATVGFAEFRGKGIGRCLVSDDQRHVYPTQLLCSGLPAIGITAGQDDGAKQLGGDQGFGNVVADALVGAGDDSDAS